MVKKKGQPVKVRFRVIDTGVGIAAHNIDKIFSPYVQANDRVHRFYGGTGLGLTIVNKIVELQGGTIEAASREGQGTTITVSLSWSEAEAPPSTTARLPRHPAFRQIQRVLVGEDDLMSQKVLQQLLARWELDATVVSNGAQVLHEVQQRSYDLLIVDDQMPELTGQEVIEALSVEQRLPIIMLSGYVPPVGPSRLSVIFLKKPVEPMVLLQSIVTLDQSPLPTRVNLDYLREITGNDPALMVDLIDTFIQQVPREIAKMKTALRQKDWPALYLAIHKSRPNFKYVGVQAVQGLLDQLEQDVERRVHQSTYAQRIKELETFTQRTIPVLNNEKNSLWKQDTEQ